MTVGESPLLEVRGLGVSLAEDRRLLDGVDLAVAPGTCVGIVGGSGAGKSLLCRALLGLVPRGATLRGSVRLQGRERLGAADESPAGPGGLGLVHQDPASALAPHRRVGAQLEDVLLAHGARDRAAARAEALRWLDRLSLDAPARRLRQYPFELSSGQRQRAAVAVALAARPGLLVADEPTSALDPPLSLDLLAVLLEAGTEGGRGLLLVSHDLGLVAAAATEVLVLDRGRVVESGPVDALYARPGHPATVRLLGPRPPGQRP